MNPDKYHYFYVGRGGVHRAPLIAYLTHRRQTDAVSIRTQASLRAPYSSLRQILPQTRALHVNRATSQPMTGHLASQHSINDKSCAI